MQKVVDYYLKYNKAPGPDTGISSGVDQDYAR